MKLWINFFSSEDGGIVGAWSAARDFVNEKLLPNGVTPDRIQITYGGFLGRGQEYPAHDERAHINTVVVAYFHTRDY